MYPHISIHWPDVCKDGLISGFVLGHREGVGRSCCCPGPG